MENRSGPLKHVTVIDLTQHLSGPFASQILGDLGAHVIKVEPPTGDPTRHIGPYFMDGDSAYFLSVNRNKESICLDLKAPQGKAALLALVKHADVVIENYRPGTLAKLGIDHDVLMSVNPKIVLCSISGFGQNGPYRDLPAFDMIVQALSGGMSLTGEIGGSPVRSGLPIGDLCAGMYGVIGTLTGLLQVAAEGKGAYIDVAMLDTQVSLLSYVASYYLLAGHISGPQGRSHMSIPTYRAFTCGDGREVVVTANTPRMWAGLCEALGVPHLVEDARFRNNEVRRDNRDQLDVLLESAALHWKLPELLERLTTGGVPCAPINHLDEALQDPQVEQRDMILDIDGPRGHFRAVGNPVKMSDGLTEHTMPPKLAQHTEQVLRTVGQLSDDEIGDLITSGAATVMSASASEQSGTDTH
jgi:CoA:oxalate CoA-transferase